VKQDPTPNAHFEAELDAALRRAPDVHAPRHFQQRLMTRLPEVHGAERLRKWQLPVLAALAALVFGAFVVAALDLGLARWLARPSMLLTVLAMETAIALAWLWSTVSSR
jgi:hypothetical protein